MTTDRTILLIQESKRGNKKAFSQICEIYYDYAYRLCFRLLGNEEDTKDAVQEAFIKIWNKITSYNPRIKFTTWIYTIITNLCIDLLRKRKNHKQLYCAEALKVVSHQNPDGSYDEQEFITIINCLSQTLSPKQQAVFVLRDLEGLDFEEIKAITGLSRNKVKSNLCHARKAIREQLVNNYKIIH